MDDRSSARSKLAPSARATPPKKPVRPVPSPVLAPPAPRAEPARPLDPTLLLVGADSAFEPALRSALSRHRVYVETTSPDTVADAVIAAAPDLILLAGEAARDGGSAVLRSLTQGAASAVVPVAILHDDAALDTRLRAFRHGAAAVIPKAASIDAIAEQVARLAREIPERGSEALGVIGEATLSEFVAALENELRSGILSVHTGDVDNDAVRLVLGSGRPLAAFVDDFVQQVKSHVLRAEPLRYEFAEHTSGTLALLDGDGASEQTPSVDVAGLRVVLADDDTGRADGVAQQLRARGVSVVVSDLFPNEARFSRLRECDPELLLIGEAQLKGPGYELLRRMRHDKRLRWASLLVVRWDEVWSDALSVATQGRLERAIASLCDADRSLEACAASETSFDTRLEVTGPARCLRALTQARMPLRVSVTNPRASFEIDLCDGLVVGASGTSRDGSERWEGALALSALLVLSSGRIHVAPAKEPATTNLMTTIDVALSMADQERSPISASLPAPADDTNSAPAESKASVGSVAQTRLARVAASPALRAGVSGSFAALMVLLAVLQGALIATVTRLLWFGHGAQHTAVTHTEKAAPQAALQSSRAAASTTSSSAASFAATGSPGAGLSHAQAVSDASPEPSTRAPSCEALLGPEQSPTSPDANAAYSAMQRAHQALVHGDLDACERALCEAVRANQTNAAIPLELAQLLLLRRDGQQAVSWAERALAQAPENLRAQGVLGDALARTGADARAKSAWLKSLRVESGSEAELKALSTSSQREARASLKRHDFARAERFFRRAALLDPQNVAASNGVSDALRKLGDNASALYWARRSLAVDPRNATAQVLLGEALLQRGDLSGARAAFHDVLELEPNNVTARLRLNRLQTEP